MTFGGTWDVLIEVPCHTKVLDIFFIAPLVLVPQTEGGKKLILLLLSF